MSATLVLSSHIVASMVMLAAPPLTIKDHVKLPGADASHLTLRMVMHPKVAKEIKLDDKQKEKVKGVVTFLRQNFRRGTPLSDQIKVFQEGGKKLAKILNKEQKARMEQLVLQGFGPAFLGMPEVGKKLKLTKEQKQKIDKLLAKYRADRRKNRGEGRDQIKKRRDAVTKAVMAVLDKKQTEAHKKLLGKKFDMPYLGRRRRPAKRDG